MDNNGQSAQQTTVAPDAAQAAQAPQSDPFISTLKERTGFESPEQIKELASFKSQAQQRIAELEQKANANPFANDLAKQVNDLLKAGKPMSEVIPFLSLQAQDFNTMEPANLIKWQKKMAMPSWNDADINDWFDSEYPSPDDDAEDAVRQKRIRELRISEKGEMARQELSQKQVDLTKPDPNEAVKSESKKAAINNAVREVGKIIDSINEIPITEENEVFGRYDFSYKPNLDPQKKQHIVNVAIQTHLLNGGSLDEQGLSRIGEDVKETVFMLSAREIIKSIIHDTHASMSENQVRRVTNTQPTPKGVTPTPKQEQKPQSTVKVKGRIFV